MTHAIEMISRMKNNAALNKARRERYQTLRNLYLDKVSHHIKSGEERVSLSKEEQEQVKKQIRIDLRKERIQAFIKTIIISIIISVVLFGIIYYLFFVREVILLNTR